MEISENFYEKSAKSFSDTRFCLWDVVKQFGEKFKENDYILDAGCGNGKNIKYFNNQTNIIGFDKSSQLVEICKNQNFNVIQGDILNIPFESEIFDYIMSIAVIHHLDSIEKHIQAIYECMRCLKKGGQCLITLWAYESDDYSKKKKFKKGENFVTFGKQNHQRFYYIYDESMLKGLLKWVNYEHEYYWERGNWNIIFTK
jgi:SAM-dependent methyltransferase